MQEPQNDILRRGLTGGDSMTSWKNYIQYFWDGREHFLF